MINYSMLSSGGKLFTWNHILVLDSGDSDSMLIFCLQSWGFRNAVVRRTTRNGVPEMAASHLPRRCLQYAVPLPLQRGQILRCKQFEQRIFLELESLNETVHLSRQGGVGDGHHALCGPLDSPRTRPHVAWCAQGHLILSQSRTL